MSFQQGLSGLNATSKSLEVIGNNIANANTFGAKASRAEFADLYAGALNGASGGAAGIGVSIASIAQQFNQGNVTTTENPLDIAINGRGFFQLEANTGETVYSRGPAARSSLALQLEAALAAVRDAGLQPGDIDGIVPSSVGSATAEDFIENFGLTDLRFSATVPMGGASAVAGPWPWPLCTASCIRAAWATAAAFHRRCRRRTIRSASAKAIVPAATFAEYSPRLCPASATGAGSRCACRRRATATLAASTASAYGSVRLAADAVVDGTFGAEEKDRRDAAGGAEAFDEADAVELGQHDVDDHGVIVGGIGEGEAGLAVGGVVGGVARLLESAHDEGGDFGIIFDDENAHEGGSGKTERIIKGGMPLPRRGNTGGTPVPL